MTRLFAFLLWGCLRAALHLARVSEAPAPKRLPLVKAELVPPPAQREPDPAPADPEIGEISRLSGLITARAYTVRLQQVGARFEAAAFTSEGIAAIYMGNTRTDALRTLALELRVIPPKRVRR